MFEKVLIANRGEIALRIIRACKEMGVRSVAVYSEADADSLHVQMADEAICIGPASATHSYLKISNIISAAEIADVDAIHPGYGFLSENAEFSEACERAGIVFIGPTPDLQRQIGDKISGRKVAIEAGVPVVPGTDEPIRSEEEALLFAKAAGYPIIIKASSGGGGRGMRVAQNQKELLEGLKSAASEAKAAFGDATVFLEKFVEKPKHVEVQILGDNHGNIVHFYERDCSIQRRHQKVIEIAPSLYLTNKKRKEVCDYALDLAKHVGYRNAGTVEFLMDKQSKF